jgi:predicted DNA-binding transcriptional regulator AlpA/predicted GIY-YIG superfamily endonuclease
VTYVYRAYDIDDQLLYVGMSDQPAKRIRTHQLNGARWADQLARVDLKYYADRESAALAESAAIVTERPRHNITGLSRPKARSVIPTHEVVDPLVDLDWLAAYLGKPKKTIYSWRLRGTGPPAYKIGQALRWRRSEVDAWLAERSEQHG